MLRLVELLVLYVVFLRILIANLFFLCYIVVILSGMKVGWLTYFTCTLWYQLNVWERCKIFMEKVMNCFAVCV